MKNMCFTLCTEKGMYLDVYDWIEGRECVWYMGKKKELQAVLTEKNVEGVCVLCMLPPPVCRVENLGELSRAGGRDSACDSAHANSRASSRANSRAWRREYSRAKIQRAEKQSNPFLPTPMACL